jgi:hypothetical protein
VDATDPMQQTPTSQIRSQGNIMSTRELALVVALAAMSPLDAQSVGVSLSAINTLPVTVTDGPQTVNSSSPTGPLPDQGEVRAWLPNVVADVQWRGGGAVSAWARITQQVAVAPGTTGATGNSGPHELLVTFTSSAPLQVKLNASRIVQAAPGAPWPAMDLDIGNDGTLEATNLSTLNPAHWSASLGPQPLQVRVVLNASLGTADYVFNDLFLWIEPDDGIDLRVLVSGCNPTLPPPPPFANRQFDGSIVLVMPQPPGTIAVIVFGFAPQPAFLGLSVGLPCLLLPSPDVLVVQTAAISLPLPPSVRPVTLYVQGVSVTMQGLLTTDGYQVTAQ